MDIVDTIQSPLIATICYKRKDNLGINVLDTKMVLPAASERLGMDNQLQAGLSTLTPLIQNNLLES
jgi:hypothetical protein